MNLSKPFLKFVCLSIGFVMIFVGLCLARTPARPPNAKDLIGVYQGYSDYDDFYRLDLRADFTGYFARVAMPRSVIHEYGVSGYRITHWSLDGFDIAFDLMPRDPKAEGTRLKGRAGAFRVLRLEESGTTNNWERELVLHPEEQTKVTSEETKEAIKQMEKK